MKRQVISEKFNGSQITDFMLQEASHLFNAHYRVWAEHAAQMMGLFAKAGELAIDFVYSSAENSFT